MERIVFLVERPTMPLSPRHRLELGEQRQRFSIEKRLSVTVERGSLRGPRNAPGGRPNLSWMGSQLIPRRSNSHLRRSRQNGLLRIAVATIGIAAGVSSPRCSSSSAFASHPHYGRARHRLSVHRLGNALMAKTSRSGAPAIGSNAHKCRAGYSALAPKCQPHSAQDSERRGRPQHRIARSVSEPETAVLNKISLERWPLA
jgi:hypothetical protein